MGSDAGNVDLGLLTLDGDRTATSLLQSEFNERSASLSPDGKWLAYESDESGQREVYVRPFPNVGESRVRISRDGGIWPVWNPGTSELFYVSPDSLMVVEYEGTSSFSPEAPQSLFDIGSYSTGQGNRRIAVAPDGQRFLLLKDEPENGEGASPSELYVVLNWFEELKERVPVN